MATRTRTLPAGDHARNITVICVSPAADEYQNAGAVCQYTRVIVAAGLNQRADSAITRLVGECNLGRTLGPKAGLGFLLGAGDRGGQSTLPGRLTHLSCVCVPVLQNSSSQNSCQRSQRPGADHVARSILQHGCVVAPDMLTLAAKFLHAGFLRPWANGEVGEANTSDQTWDSSSCLGRNGVDGSP